MEPGCVGRRRDHHGLQRQSPGEAEDEAIVGTLQNRRRLGQAPEAIEDGRRVASRDDHARGAARSPSGGGASRPRPPARRPGGRGPPEGSPRPRRSPRAGEPPRGVARPCAPSRPGSSARSSRRGRSAAGAGGGDRARCCARCGPAPRWWRPARPRCPAPGSVGPRRSAPARCPPAPRRLAPLARRRGPGSDWRLRPRAGGPSRAARAGQHRPRPAAL